MTYSVLEMMKLAEEEGKKKTPFLVRHAKPISILLGTVPGSLLGMHAGLALGGVVARRAKAVYPSDIEIDLSKDGLVLGGLTGGLVNRALFDWFHKKKRKEKLDEGEEGEKTKSFRLHYPRGMGFIAGAVPGALFGRAVGQARASRIADRTLVFHPQQLNNDLRLGGLVLGGIAGGLAGRALAKRHYEKKRKEKTASVLDAVIMGPEKVAEQTEEQRKSSRTRKLLIGLGAALGAGVLGSRAYKLYKLTDPHKSLLSLNL